ncbi:hypothetical protein ACFQ15_01075 [Sphingomonas hankookensis]|uniref:hypothetical protein n=1 Tax=Sphingomonas hankookensis TaxID=563996 RepID=UPI001F56BD90|nr:hypothetical protein [Sphingomonas hankookensis]
MTDGVEDQKRVVVERLYAMFAAPPPSRITGCRCCLDSPKVARLLRTPLRAIDRETLWWYAWKAFLTVGDVADFRYLLPRILDVSLRHPGDAVDVEIVLGKLRLAGWAQWSDDERAAIIAAIDLLFDQAVATVDDPDDGELAVFEVESVLCGAARADLDPVRWLERLSQRLRQSLHARLSGAPNGFWEDAPVGLAAAHDWLACRPVDD